MRLCGSTTNFPDGSDWPLCSAAGTPLSCAAVPRIESGIIEVYIFRRRGRRVEFLTLRRAPGRRLAGVWQPVTGKIEPGEAALEAARREVLEETGLAPRRWWALETVTTYFDPAADVIRCLPLFAAEIGPRERVTLSAEHDDHRFLTAREAARRYIWYSQVAALAALRREVLGGRPRARNLEVTARVRGGGARPTGRRTRTHH